MHILDKVFLRKNVDYIVKKLTNAQFFSLHAIQLNTFAWSEAVTKLKYLPT